MELVPDKKLLSNLKLNDSASFEQLYALYFPPIKKYILKNSGNLEDAEDIFQEAVLILNSKIQENDFTLTASLKTYLFGISKNLWLKHLRSNRMVLSAYNLEDSLTEYETFDVELKKDQTAEEVIAKFLLKISGNCFRILTALFLMNESMEKLMVKMGWKNRHTADNQKYKCLQQARKQASNPV